MAAVVKAWGVVVIRNVVVLVWTWGASCSSVGRWGGGVERASCTGMAFSNFNLVALGNGEAGRGVRGYLFR